MKDETGIGCPVVSCRGKKDSPKGGKIGPILSAVISGVTSGLQKSGEQSDQQNSQDQERLHRKIEGMKAGVPGSPKGKKGKGPMDETRYVANYQNQMAAKEGAASKADQAASAIGSAIGSALAKPDESRKRNFDF